MKNLQFVSHRQVGTGNEKALILLELNEVAYELKRQKIRGNVPQAISNLGEGSGVSIVTK